MMFMSKKLYSYMKCHSLVFFSVQFTGSNELPNIINVDRLFHDNFRLTSVIGGIQNTFSTAAGVICPIVAGVLTPNVRLRHFSVRHACEEISKNFKHQKHVLIKYNQISYKI